MCTRYTDLLLTEYGRSDVMSVLRLGCKKTVVSLLEANIRRTLFDINHSKILFDPPPREMEIKTKINK